jgi:F0F1-type ATP synthase assembly protein I
MKKAELISLVFELGFMVAIPIVLLALGGRLLDKYLDTSPLFILVGIGLALCITTFLVYKKITKILY